MNIASNGTPLATQPLVADASVDCTKVAPALAARALKYSCGITANLIMPTLSEPLRVCRRPQLLRGWGYDKQDDEQVFS
jgi:hypothetical protein